MSLELSLKEIDHYQASLDAEFESLINSPPFGARKSSQQWRFFRHCFEVLMGRATGDYAGEPKHIVNYKFEINERLRLYYLAAGRSVSYIFKLVSAKKAGVAEMREANYPSCNGYFLKVYYNEDDPDQMQLRKLAVEKAISQAIDAEFAAYEGLAETDLENLASKFDRNSSAYKRIANIVRAHRDKRGWTLTNQDNPSTKRLIDVYVKDLSDKTAEARTTEYWLLMWWDSKSKRYAHYYSETNRQTYFLEKRKNKWIVTDNPYPRPTTSASRRNIRRYQQRLTKGVTD